MLLESGRIYLGYKKCNYLLMPSLEITTGVKVYASNKSTKPNSINEMEEIKGLENNKINSFYSVPRWIAVIYENDNAAAYEQGLITDPFNSRSSIKVIENYEALVDNNTYLAIDQSGTYLVF